MFLWVLRPIPFDPSLRHGSYGLSCFPFCKENSWFNIKRNVRFLEVSETTRDTVGGTKKFTSTSNFKPNYSGNEEEPILSLF